MGFTLETERLFLRELTAGDAGFAFALNSDPEVVRYTGDGPFASIEEAQTFLQNYPDYARNGFGRWGVELKASGELIGWCGLKRDPDTGEVDLGYRFFRKDWNKGYATEAAIPCLHAGFDRFHIDRIVGRAAGANRYSWRILEKIGMRFVEDFEDEGELWKLYEKLNA